MAKQYAAIITSKGQALIAAAIKGGTTVNITEIAVGDGNGSTPVPTVGQTALINETARININSLTVDAGNANHVIADGVIPAETGGFWLREVGLFTDDGILLAASALPPTYKPSAEEGATNSQRILITLIVSDISAVNITVDNTTVMASESYVDDKIAAHEKSRNHPDGTLTAKGFVQLSSSTASTSETLAATPKAVKAANDNANGRLPSGGTAVAATKLATARKIAGVAFDGTADITLESGNIGGLGTAATKNVGTAAGNVMEVGAFGLGGNGVTVADANTIDKNGIYRLTVDGIHGPAAKVAAEIIHIQYDGASANQIGWVAGAGKGKMYHRARSGSVFGDWIPLIDQNGGLIAGNDTPLILQNTGAVADKKAIGIRGTNSDATRRWFVGSGSNGKDDVHLINYGADAQLVLAETCTINKPLKVTGNFDATGSGNFPGGVAAAGGIILNSSSPVGMYFGSDGASFTAANMLLKSWYGIGFYNTCTTSGIQGITSYINVRTGNMSMKGTITPGDYSNFDARYSLKNTASKAAAGWFKDATTGMIFQWGGGKIAASGAKLTFPIAFPTACLRVIATDVGADHRSFGASPSSTTQAVFYPETNGTSCSYFAIGY